MTKKMMILIGVAILAAGPVFAQDKPTISIEKKSIPSNFRITAINDQADAEQCTAPNKLHLTNRCSEITNAAGKKGKRCEFDCLTPDGKPVQ